MDKDMAIVGTGVSKKFCKSIKHVMTNGAADIARDFLGIRSNTGALRDGEFWAVNGVSFELRKGETLGIIGHNGSGKSTMLKMLNGIYMPDAGRIEICGRVGALIEVGAGFHPMLTGRENIYINGAILGMSKAEIDAKYDEIVEFADIGDFVHSPVRHYSSGMFVRLGMAIAVNLQPEILLVDEVLSVGDLTFQNKSMRRLAEIRKKANAVVFVSHNLEHIRTLCQKVLVMQKGEAVYYGDVRTAIAKYLELSNESKMVAAIRAADSGCVRQSSGHVEVYGSGLLDAKGEKTDRLQIGDDVVFFVNFLAHIDILKPLIGVSIVDDKNTVCVWHTNADMNVSLSSISSGARYNCTVRFASPMLLPGIYSVHFTLRDAESYATYERIFNLNSFAMEGEAGGKGVVRCDSLWQLDHAQ